MPTLRVPALLKYYLNGQTETTLPGATVAEFLQALVTEHPKIEGHIFDSKGNVRRHINLFVNADNIRDLHGLETRLEEGDIVKLVPSVTGG
jgi:sulfur-carrier protein